MTTAIGDQIKDRIQDPSKPGACGQSPHTFEWKSKNMASLYLEASKLYRELSVLERNQTIGMATGE